MKRVRTTFGEVEVGGKFFVTPQSPLQYTKNSNWYASASPTAPIAPILDTCPVWVEEEEEDDTPDFPRLPTVEEIGQCPLIVRFWLDYFCGRVRELQEENINLLQDKADLLQQLLDEKER